MNDNTDPFACFESSDEDGESDDATSREGQDSLEKNDANDPQKEGRRENNQEKDKRYSGNGVLAFHEGTELALLHYVRTELTKRNNPTKYQNDYSSRKEDADSGTSGGDSILEIINKAQTVLDLIDSYCISRHWMMHVGPEKAKPLQQFIHDCLAQKEKRNGSMRNGNVLTLVELGTYCGYSSIFTAKTVLDYLNHNEVANKSGSVSRTIDSSFSFHIYSVEVVEKFATVARELIRLAGMESYISIILSKSQCGSMKTEKMTDRKRESSLSAELKRIMISSKRCTESAINSIDFLFVDHDKSLYLPHLQELESARLIRKGTYVAADNVIFAEIYDYRQYMADLAIKGIVATRLEDSLFVEYCQPELIKLSSSPETMTGRANDKNDERGAPRNIVTKDTFRDGIEFSVYLQDPF